MIRTKSNERWLLTLFFAVSLLTAPLSQASQQAAPEVSPQKNKTSFAISTVTVRSGDTLDGILAQTGLPPERRQQATLAIAAHYDVNSLRPGQRLEFYWRQGTKPRLERIEMTVEEGAKIEIAFNDTVTARLVTPELESYDRTTVGRISGSLYNTLINLRAPQRFAVDLPAMFGSLVAFNKELHGGEPIALVWSERQTIDGVRMGDQVLRYARLELSDRVMEIMLDTDESTAALIYQDGKLIRRLIKPVTGARLSSVFGKRQHPVFGNMRMHTGVDYAAPRGTPVRATASGRIAFKGQIRGYGRVIDVDHGNGTVTRYAHLSQFAADLTSGHRVATGTIIGNVGASGTATGPNLHYEVRLNGRPVDPLSGRPKAIAFQGRTPTIDDRDKLQDYRFLFPDLLAKNGTG